MAETTLLLADEEATVAAGSRLAPALRPGDIVALAGDLGAGKTSFARGLLAGLGLADEAPSPSFAIVLAYDPPEVRLPIWHVDLFRLDDPEEADELGLDEVLADGVLVIEWPERLGRALPASALRLRLDGDGAGRRLTCHLPASWAARWPFR